MRARTARLGSAIGLAVVAFAGFAAEAWAQGAAPPQVPGLPGADKDEEREGRPKPYAEDQRTAHFYIDGFFTSVFPVGNVAPESTVNEVASFGFLAGGALGVGISRDAEIDVRGGYGLLSSPTECASCSSNLASASLGFSYHLLQGASFDPWIRFGAGYRTFQIDHGEDESPRVTAVATGRYHAVDVAQITLGGDFFPTPGFGFGPWFEADIGTVVDWPDGSLEGARPYAFFLIGVEIELDPVQWAQPPAPVAAAEATPQRF